MKSNKFHKKRFWFQFHEEIKWWLTCIFHVEFILHPHPNPSWSILNFAALFFLALMKCSSRDYFHDFKIFFQNLKCEPAGWIDSKGGTNLNLIGTNCYFIICICQHHYFLEFFSHRDAALCSFVDVCRSAAYSHIEWTSAKKVITKSQQFLDASGGKM